MTGRRSASSSAGRSPRPGRRLVLLDTNALLLPFTAGIDLRAEVRRWDAAAVVAVPTGARGELDRLVARGVRFAVAARALAASFPELPTDRRGDAGLLELARERGAAVVTADRGLGRRLRAAGVPVLTPRDRNRLTALGPRPGPKRPVRSAGRATVKKRPRLGRE